MPKYKKCPRCELNYILENQDFCEICKEELRGISHNIEIDDVDESEVCPRCHVNFLNEGEKYCEACMAEMEEDKARAIDEVEPDWDIAEDEEVDDVVVDDDVELSVEDLAEEEALLAEEEEDSYIDSYEEEDDLDINLDELGEDEDGEEEEEE